MSHQSGIKVSEELANTFSEAVKNGNTRILRVSIIDEALSVNGTTPVEGTFEQDYAHVLGYLDDKVPAYVLVRLDTKNSEGEYNWLFLAHVPDNAKVRDKMLYASTRASLTKELGDNRFSDNMYGTDKNEFSWEGYKKHLAHKNADAPLTQRERELAEIKQAEARAATDYQGTTSRQTFSPHITYPIADEVKTALSELTKPKDERPHNFVTLHLVNEKIVLDSAANVSTDQIHRTIDPKDPRFTFFIMENNGAEHKVFVYSCPSSSKIRERMLYSCSKNFAIKGAEGECGLTVDKKLETSDPTELTEKYLLEEVRPEPRTGGAGIVAERVQMLSQPAQGGFKRPAAPNRRRPQQVLPTQTAAADP